MTYKLIEIYNQFMKTEEMNNYGLPSNETDEQRLDKLFHYIARELNNLFSKLINYNRAIYVFIDYKFPDVVMFQNPLFKDFIDSGTDRRERLNCLSMIRRDVVDLVLSSPDGDIFNHSATTIRCLYELIDRNGRLDGYDVVDYVSINSLIKRYQTNTQTGLLPNDVILSRLNYLNNIGRFRYIMLRGAKFSTRHKRSNRLFGFFTHDEWVENNVNATLLNVLKKNDINKIKRFNQYIPFSLVLYSLPIIISYIRTKGIYYLGCEIESDFAISKHVHTYSKRSFPTIYTTDTDLLVLLSDVDCVVKMNHPGSKKPLLINPTIFWKQVFETNAVISPRIIRILCVLLGTDYNPYSNDSPIHLKNFKEVLRWLNVQRFEDIDEDLLLVQIYKRMKANPNHKCVQQTAFALNVYLNDIETNLHFINNIDIQTIDVKQFFDIFRASWFNYVK